MIHLTREHTESDNSEAHSALHNIARTKVRNDRARQLVRFLVTHGNDKAVSFLQQSSTIRTVRGSKAADFAFIQRARQQLRPIKPALSANR